MSEASSSTSKAKPRASGHVRIGLPELAWKVSSALPRAERRALALRLLEAEADEITFRRQGTRWTAFVWDHVISGRLFIDGGFQEPEIRAVLAWMRRHGRIAASRDIIVDVGANVGTSTIPFALETDCRILAIEPIPEVFALLRRNIADNGLAARITCAQAAISAAADQVQMVLPAGNSGGAEVYHRGHEPNFLGRYPVRDVVDVPAMALDKLLEVHDVAPERVAFVWSDTQGCEAEVIETGRRLWAVGVPLFAEFDPRTWDKTNGARALLAAATECFAGFIAAETLTAGAADTADPITELADFCRAIGPEGSDVLLLPKCIHSPMQARTSAQFSEVMEVHAGPVQE